MQSKNNYSDLDKYIDGYGMLSEKVSINEEETKSYMVYLWLDGNSVKIGTKYIKPTDNVRKALDSLPTDLLNIEPNSSYLMVQAKDKVEAMKIGKLKLQKDILKLKQHFNDKSEDK